MLDVLTSIGLVWTGGAAGFVLGCLWHKWVYYTAPAVATSPSVQALDQIYSLGVADERARCDAEIRQLDRMGARAAKGPPASVPYKKPVSPPIDIF